MRCFYYDFSPLNYKKCGRLENYLVTKIKSFIGFCQKYETNHVFRCLMQYSILKKINGFTGTITTIMSFTKKIIVTGVLSWELQ